MRSLYLRLLAGFGIVLLLATSALYQTYIAVTGPQIASMIVGSQAVQSNEAAAALLNGGIAAAADYIRRLDATTQMTHYLTDAEGRDVISGDDRAAMVRRSAALGSGPYQDGDRVVFVTPATESPHRLITLAPLPFRVRDVLLPGILILGAVLLLFSLVAADIVRPVRRLADAVQRFGKGDLSARADIRRRDEIGQLAAAFNEMAERIQNLVTGERRLLQDVSHELRSPLTRLNIGIDLLRTAPNRQQAADRLQREAGRLSDLVSTLLEVVRLEGDPGSTPMAPLTVATVLNESVDDCATEAAQRNVTIHVTGAEGGAVIGNAELLRRAFDNVLGNAARYAPPDSVVSIRCTQDGSEQVVEVRDLGPGVRDDQLDKLGSAFFRADESRNAETGGLGLGLAIARRALHLHRGTMEIANANPGLRVTIRIPLSAA